MAAQAHEVLRPRWGARAGEAERPGTPAHGLDVTPRGAPRHEHGHGGTRSEQGQRPSDQPPAAAFFRRTAYRLLFSHLLTIC